MSQKSTLNRYSAKLLFQFRVVVDGIDNTMRTVEERILVLKARTAKQALVEAKKRGRREQYDYKNDENNPVFFEFIGISDLICLTDVCGPDEVWYDIKTMKQPMERKSAIIPSDSNLLSRVNEP